jgi:DNA polymerase-1
MGQTKAIVHERGYVTTIFGRKCHYPRVSASNPSERAFNERAAINAPIHGRPPTLSAARLCIRCAMVRMDAASEQAKISANMLLQVHDELVFEMSDSEVEATISTR